MNLQQQSLVESLSRRDKKGFVNNILDTVTHDLTGEYYEGRRHKEAMGTVEAFVQTYIDQGEATLVLYLPDGGSRITFWIYNEQLQMKLVRNPEPMRFASERWGSLQYSEQWLPIPLPEQRQPQRPILWFLWPPNWFKRS